MKSADTQLTPQCHGAANLLISFLMTFARRTGTLVVAEVKSLTPANEEQQLRLSLGQVLRYRQILRRTHRRVDAVLMLESDPTDRSWINLSEKVAVSLRWPGAPG